MRLFRRGDAGADAFLRSLIGSDILHQVLPSRKEDKFAIGRYADEFERSRAIYIDLVQPGASVGQLVLSTVLHGGLVAKIASMTD